MEERFDAPAAIVPVPAFGSMLRRYRRAAGMSQAALGAAAGFSTVYITMLERGRRQPPASTVGMLADALSLAAADRERLLWSAGNDPPRTASGLPWAADTFVGRRAEMTIVGEMFRRPGCRQITLVGTGGVGKTRLAIEVARRLQPEIGAEAIFVALDSVTSERDVEWCIAEALRVRRKPGVPTGRLICDALADRNIVLVLDNFEHVIPAAALVIRLVQSGPEVRVLVTSRTPLATHGEHVFPLAPLAAPSGGFDSVSGLDASLEQLASVATSDAVTLFVERARAADPAFVLTAENAGAVARACSSLDGLPLALELAAARLRHASLDSVAESLWRPVSRHPIPAAGERHESLDSVFDWSFHLLSGTARAVFPRMSVFAGEFSPEAVREVCRFPGEPEIDEAMDTLVDASLVQVRRLAAGERRFAFLRTVREYASHRLGSGPDADTAHRRHFDHYLALTEACALPAWSEEAAGPGLELDLPNVLTALSWSRDHWPWQGLRLVATLVPFWESRGDVRTGIDWCDQMLAAADGAPPDSTPEHGQQAVYAKVLIGKAVLCAEAGDLGAASRAGDEGLALHRRLDHKPGLAWALNGRALVHLCEGQYLAARELIAEALELVREMGDQPGILLLTNNLGVLVFHLGDDSASLPLFEASLRLAGDQGNRRAVSRALNNIACVRVRRRDYAGAAAIGAEGLTMRHEIGDIRGVCESFELLAGAASGLGEHARAVQLASAARSLRTRQGLGPPVDFLRSLADSALQSAIEVLGQEEVRAISAAAGALSPDDAVALGAVSRGP